MVMESADDSASPGSRKWPRLFIKEMVMRNFKSYAGEQRVGPFHKSFSAVVGPNGSGKSNVIDAMLFVFGKRAKQMRLNKVSELIHNSTNYQNLDSAGVSVHFQEIVDLDDGTYEAIQGSDFVISRVAFRDNSSKYYINDRPSNFTEVTKKLKGKGVDLDNNRFLILQGEVEQISLMKPKGQGPHDEGFLEYLEDIIGTDKYVEKIDESYKDMNFVMNYKYCRTEDVKNEAEAYMLKELSLLKWQEKATNLAYEDTSLKIVELQENVSKLEENLKNEREKIQDNNKTLKELESVHNKYMRRQEELDNDLRVSKEEFKEFERQDVKYREDSKHMKQKIKKLEVKVEKDSSKIDDLTKECEHATNQIPKLEENIPKLLKLLLDEEKLLEQIKENAKVETERYRSELATVRAELEPWEKELIVHKGKLEVTCTESKLLCEKHEAGRKAFEDAQRQMDDILRRIDTKTTAIRNMQGDLEKNKLEAMEAHNECFKEQETLIPLEQAARQKVAELKSVMDSEKSQGSVLKAILQAKESNQIEGIYGRMGDLGAIDGLSHVIYFFLTLIVFAAKYDIAVSTACPGLDYIVVETTSAAQACVELLRREKLGVATFMILEKQVDLFPKMKEHFSTPENVPRLFDLIKVKDERMKLAFYAAMGNTLVAKDLDQATRIAYSGNKEFRRVVTLDGALFEKSGTMSGGGSKPRGGKMGTSIRPTSVSAEAIINAEKELSAMVDNLSRIRQKIADAVKHYQASEKAVAHLEMELAKSRKEIESLKSQHSYLEKQLDSLKAASEPRKDEIDRLEELQKIISAEEKEIEKIVNGSKDLKEKALQLQSKVENAGGEKLKAQKLKVDKIQSDIDKSSTEINRHKVQIETAQKMIKKLTKGIAESKKEKEQLVEERVKMERIFDEILEKAHNVQEHYTNTQKLIDQHRDVLDKAKNDYEKLKKTVDELRASEIEADYKLQDLKRSYKELEMRGKGYKKRLDDLQITLLKHLEQIQKDLVDPEKLQATLADQTLSDACDLKRALEMVALLEAQLKELNPNLDSITESELLYRRKVAAYNERVEDLTTVTQQRDDVKKQLDEFMAGFNAISLKLKEMYQMITLGGDAELELVDSLDPFSEGVVFSVRPPKKSWKNIANLSGGEKTLSSLALVFALHHYKPTPLYVMDEIDAALDFKNVSIVGHYVKDRTKDAQFIIISLRNNMFELADRLVGIYKTDNCTKSITINPGSFTVCENAGSP
ncbi:Structural maintenance of chromosomes protein 4 [Citrus sinensis]|nr:Structural maintenance of chromosomes protein 4 [Citrus sinensis]